MRDGEGQEREKREKKREGMCESWGTHVRGAKEREKERGSMRDKEHVRKREEERK